MTWTERTDEKSDVRERGLRGKVPNRNCLNATQLQLLSYWSRTNVLPDCVNNKRFLASDAVARYTSSPAEKKFFFANIRFGGWTVYSFADAKVTEIMAYACVLRNRKKWSVFRVWSGRFLTQKSAERIIVSAKEDRFIKTDGSLLTEVSANFAANMANSTIISARHCYYTCTYCTRKKLFKNLDRNKHT